MSQGTAQEIRVNVAAVWLSDHSCRIESFANSERTTEHGTHVSGFKRALVGALRQALPEACAELTSAEIFQRAKRGLRAVVSMLLIDPQYGHPTRDRLHTSRARDAVCMVTEPAMRSLIQAETQLRDRLLGALRLR